MNTAVHDLNQAGIRWVPYAILAALLVVIPAAAMWGYVLWSASVLKEGVAFMMQQGVVAESMDQIPGWGLVYGVGTWGPITLLALISWQVWKQSRRVIPMIGAASCLALGLGWGWTVF